LGRWRWVWVAVAAVLLVAGAVAANQILSDGVWQWWPWAPVAVSVALLGGVVTERLTRSASDSRHVAPDGAEAGQRPIVVASSPSAVQVGEGDGG
jgi:hypothetical protein